MDQYDYARDEQLIAEIRRVRRESDATVYLFRLVGVRLGLNNGNLRRCAGLLGISERGLRRWLDAYAEGGLGALRAGLRCGRPGSLDAQLLAQLEELLRQPPGDFDLGGLPDVGASWRGDLLQRLLSRRFGIDLGLRQCQRLLAKWRRGDLGNA